MESKDKFIPNEKEMIDLTKLENQEAVDELSYLGFLGQFVLKLLEKAKAENKDLLIEGFGTGNFTIVYDGEPVYFMSKMSVDPGGDDIDRAQYSISKKDLRKPWVRGILESLPGYELIEKRAITLKQLCLDAAGESLDLIDLKEQYPKISTADILTVVEEELKKLGTNFRFRPLPNREFCYLDFVDKELERKYIDNDPTFEAMFGPIVKDIVTAVHAGLKAKNDKKS